jgi:hypothetical protein
VLRLTASGCLGETGREAQQRVDVPPVPARHGHPLADSAGAEAELRAVILAGRPGWATPAGPARLTRSRGAEEAIADVAVAAPAATFTGNRVGAGAEAGAVDELQLRGAHARPSLAREVAGAAGGVADARAVLAVRRRAATRRSAGAAVRVVGLEVDAVAPQQS